jgi:hypothetical protein
MDACSIRVVARYQWVFRPLKRGKILKRSFKFKPQKIREMGGIAQGASVADVNRSVTGDGITTKDGWNYQMGLATS